MPTWKKCVTSRPSSWMRDVFEEPNDAFHDYSEDSTPELTQYLSISAPDCQTTWDGSSLSQRSRLYNLIGKETEKSKSLAKCFHDSRCTLCGDLLEHTLRGVRILQFSCGHFSHEKWFESIRLNGSKCCPMCKTSLVCSEAAI